jgi:hypothetical protein
MVNVALTEAEATMLQEVIESYLSDLRMEIADTDSQDVREQLKKQEEFLKKLLGQLKQ